jgi:hypothetical protein
MYNFLLPIPLGREQVNKEIKQTRYAYRIEIKKTKSKLQCFFFFIGSKPWTSRGRAFSCRQAPGERDTLSVINLFLSDFRHSLTELQVKILYKSVAK